MSWKRAVAAGAKQQARNANQGGKRVTNRPNKCAAPGCNNRVKRTVNGYDICNDHGCATWATLD